MGEEDLEEHEVVEGIEMLREVAPGDPHRQQQRFTPPTAAVYTANSSGSGSRDAARGRPWRRRQRRHADLGSRRGAERCHCTEICRCDGSVAGGVLLAV